MVPPRNKFVFNAIVEKLSAYNIYEDVAVRIMGGMAPIFGVSESCGDASWTYLGNLFLSLLAESEDRGLPEEWVLRSKQKLFKEAYQCSHPFFFSV